MNASPKWDRIENALHKTLYIDIFLQTTTIMNWMGLKGLTLNSQSSAGPGSTRICSGWKRGTENYERNLIRPNILSITVKHFWCTLFFKMLPRLLNFQMKIYRDQDRNCLTSLVRSASKLRTTNWRDYRQAVLEYYYNSNLPGADQVFCQVGDSFWGRRLHT